MLATTIEAARQLRDQASVQYVSANAAMAKWQRWNKRLVTDADDRSGEYSGAATRARGYRDAGYALCQSASLVGAMLREVPVADPELRTVTMRAAPLPCELVSISWTDYDHFSSTWLALKQRAREREEAILDVCRQKIPGWAPPPPSLPVLTLLVE
jgi:hypothetical protein